MKKPVIVWLRQDQRLSDHPALAAAVASKRTVLPCYVLDTRNAHPWRLGGASRWWLHHSLAELGQRIREMGGYLMLKRGDPVGIITQLALETEAAAVYWSSAIEPNCRRDETSLKASLEVHGIGADRRTAYRLRALIKTSSGSPQERYQLKTWAFCDTKSCNPSEKNPPSLGKKRSFA